VLTRGHFFVQMPRSKSANMLPLTILPPEQVCAFTSTETPLEPPKVTQQDNFSGSQQQCSSSQ
jgi:hypothetical protein